MTNYQAAFDRAVEAHPELGPSGYHVGEGFETFYSDPDLVRQFGDAVEFIQAHGERKVFNRYSSSYGEKHEVEEWNKARREGNPYVANGVYILACLACGVPVKRLGTGPNAVTKVRAPNGR